MVRAQQQTIQNNININKPSKLTSNQDGDATTYLITCPTSVAASACGIPGKGMTAISASSSAQLINTNGAK
jgi:hypothetical protein